MTRIEGLDSLRGLMLLLMMFNHLLFMNFSKWMAVSKTSYGLMGYVTAAEGFYFLSGLICAVVFARKAQTEPGLVRSRTRLRAAELLRWHILTLAFAVLIVLLVPGARSTLTGNPFYVRFLQDPALTFVLGLGFLAMPPFLNILPLYILFLYVTPMILERLARRQHLLVLALSVGLWGLAQSQLWFKAFGILQAGWPELPLEAGYFDPMAWQLVFVGGLVTGSLLVEERLVFLLRYKLLFVVSTAIWAYLWMHKHDLIHASSEFPTAWTDIARLGPMRVLNFGSVALTVGFLLARVPKAFAIRPLIFLGRHSLHVFVYHVAFLYATITLKGWIDELNVAASCLVFAGFIATLWVPAWLHDVYQSRSRSTAPSAA